MVIQVFQQLLCPRIKLHGRAVSLVSVEITQEIFDTDTDCLDDGIHGFTSETGVGFAYAVIGSTDEGFIRVVRQKGKVLHTRVEMHEEGGFPLAGMVAAWIELAAY